MSEKKEEGKKKGGKLPIIIAVVAILGGGGYFGMKKDTKGKKEAPKIELAHGEGSVIELDEKLYNLADKATFLRVTMAFHMKKGFDGSHITPDITAAVDDAVLSVLTQKRPEDLFGIANQKRLKRELAWAVNSQLHHEEPAEEEPKKEESKDKKGKEKKEEAHEEEEAHGHSTEFDPKFEPENPNFDSDDGPVLKVYFRSLAIQ